MCHIGRPTYNSSHNQKKRVPGKLSYSSCRASRGASDSNHASASGKKGAETSVQVFRPQNLRQHSAVPVRVSQQHVRCGFLSFSSREWTVEVVFLVEGSPDLASTAF
jgi:hypothetical protein